MPSYLFSNCYPQYTKPYLAAHELSWPSYRYLGFFWMIMAALLVFGSIWHVLTRRGGGTVGTTLNKYSMKQLILERKTNKSGKTRGKSYSSPTLGQSFGLVVLFLLAFLLCYIGPDYIDPRTCTFGGECKPASSSGPPKTTFAPGSKRDTILSSYPDTDESAMNRLFPRQGLNPGGWAPCECIICALIFSFVMLTILPIICRDGPEPFFTQYRARQAAVDQRIPTWRCVLRHVSPLCPSRPQVVAIQHLCYPFLDRLGLQVSSLSPMREVQQC